MAADLLGLVCKGEYCWTTACLRLFAEARATAFAAGPGYSLTVNADRLINAQNEPQNWLMENGDYSSIRYSKLTAINNGQ